MGIGAYQAGARTPQLAEDRQWIVHTFNVITMLQDLKNEVSEAEHAQLIYLITGDSAYLANYDPAVDVARSLLQQLKQVTSDNAEQKSRSPQLEHQLNFTFREMQQALAASSSQGLEGGREMVKHNLSKYPLETIVALTDAAVASWGLALLE